MKDPHRRCRMQCFSCTETNKVELFVLDKKTKSFGKRLKFRIHLHLRVGHCPHSHLPQDTEGKKHFNLIFQRDDKMLKTNKINQYFPSNRTLCTLRYFLRSWESPSLTQLPLNGVGISEIMREGEMQMLKFKMRNACWEFLLNRIKPVPMNYNYV